MASAAIAISATSAPLSAPPLLSLATFNRIPRGYLAHAETTEDTLPLVEPGEVVVVDPYQPDLAENALFVIEYGRGTSFPSRHIIEPRRCPDVAGGLAADCWWAGAYTRPRSQQDWRERQARGGRIISGLSEGPAERIYFNERLIGRIVGIYRPTDRRVG